MANSKLIITQRTNRHVIKSFTLSSSDLVFSNNFGVFSTSGNDLTHLNSPHGMCIDTDNYIYVCDHNNQRIVKLTNDLQFEASLDTSSTVRYPCCIYFDELSNNFYVVGINYHIIENNVLYMYVNLARYTNDFTLVKYTWDVLGINQRLEQKNGEIGYKPLAIVKGQLTNEFYIAGIRDKIYSVTELSTGFDILQDILYYNELSTRFLGMILHSNGYYYVNNGRSILKFDSALTNVGDSDFIDKVIFGLRETITGNILVYNCSKQSILEYDQNLNFVKEVIKNSGSTLQTDFYDIFDMMII